MNDELRTPNILMSESKKASDDFKVYGVIKELIAMVGSILVGAMVVDG